MEHGPKPWWRRARKFCQFGVPGSSDSLASLLFLFTAFHKFYNSLRSVFRSNSDPVVNKGSVILPPSPLATLPIMAWPCEKTWNGYLHWEKTLLYHCICSTSKNSEKACFEFRLTWRHRTCGLSCFVQSVYLSGMHNASVGLLFEQQVYLQARVVGKHKKLISAFAILNSPARCLKFICSLQGKSSVYFYKVWGPMQIAVFDFVY